MCALFETLKISRRYSVSCHVRWSISREDATTRMSFLSRTLSSHKTFFYKSPQEIANDERPGFPARKGVCRLLPVQRLIRLSGYFVSHNQRNEENGVCTVRCARETEEGYDVINISHQVLSLYLCTHIFVLLRFETRATTFTDSVEMRTNKQSLINRTDWP